MNISPSPLGMASEHQAAQHFLYNTSHVINLRIRKRSNCTNFLIFLRIETYITKMPCFFESEWICSSFLQICKCLCKKMCVPSTTCGFFLRRLKVSLSLLSDRRAFHWKCFGCLAPKVATATEPLGRICPWKCTLQIDSPKRLYYVMINEWMCY